MIDDGLILIIVLLLSGLLSGSEVAFFSIDRSFIHKLKRTRHKVNQYKIDWILNQIKKPEQVLAIILFGNLLANIIISEVGNNIIHSLFSFEQYSQTISIIIITIIILIFAEIMPKIIAMRSAEKWLFTFKFILSLIFSLGQLLLSPFLSLANYISNKIPKNQYNYKEEDLLASIEIANSYALLNSNEKLLLENTVTFQYDTAFSCLIPKSKLLMVSKSSHLKTIKMLFKKNNQDIAIIFNKENQIIGYIPLFICLQSIYNNEKLLKNKIQELAFLPESTLLSDTLQFLIQNNHSIIGLLSEDGNFSGILTLNSLLKRILGETLYLNANSNILITKKEDNIFLIDGALSLDDFNDFFKVHLEQDDTETIAGYIVKRLDGFPTKSTTIHIQHLYFYNMKMSSHKIDQLTVEVKANV